MAEATATATTETTVETQTDTVEITATETAENYFIGGTETKDNNQEFKVPEEYKDKGWAKNIKSMEDLFKSFDNAQSLIGKKAEALLPDFDNADDETLNNFYSKITPKETKDYGFENTNEYDEKLLTMFKNNGITKRQAQNLAKEFNEINSSLISQVKNKDGLTNEIASELGGDIDSIRNNTNSILNKYADEKDAGVLKDLNREQMKSVSKVINRLLKDIDVDNGSTSILSNSNSNNYSTKDEYTKLVEYYNGNYNNMSNAEIKNTLNKINNFKF
jgi:hypothetical protein